MVRGRSKADAVFAEISPDTAPRDTAGYRPARWGQCGCGHDEAPPWMDPRVRQETETNNKKQKKGTILSCPLPAHLFIFSLASCPCGFNLLSGGGLPPAGEDLHCTVCLHQPVIESPRLPGEEAAFSPTGVTFYFNLFCACL